MDDTRRTLLESLPLGIAALVMASKALGAVDMQPGQPLQSLALPFAEMKATGDATHTTRQILNGVTHSGAHIEVHESTLAPGAMPHPPHHHVNEELILLSKGTIDMTIAGKTTRLTPGSAAFVHSNEEHGTRNVGDVPAQYFVVAI
jgi:quercetin dioxygenase-like cupin family protein